MQLMQPPSSEVVIYPSIVCAIPALNHLGSGGEGSLYFQAAKQNDESVTLVLDAGSSRILRLSFLFVSNSHPINVSQAVWLSLLGGLSWQHDL